MIIKNSGTLGKAALLDKDEIKWEYEANQFNIARFLFLPLNDMWMPHLEITSNYGASQVILFYDQIIYRLSEKQYCTQCFSMLEEGRFYPYCDTCLQESGLFFLKCYERGVGLGSGECAFEDPVCNSQFCANYCKSGFSVYLAIIDEKNIKIGVTKEKNIFYKLLEEGVPFGMSFHLQADSIKDALQLKEKSKRKLGWSHYLLFEDKLKICENLVRDNVSNPDLEAISGMAQDEGGIKLDKCWNLMEHAFNIPTKIDYSNRMPLELNGVLTGFWGSIGFFRENGQVLAFDIKSLTGRLLENVVG